MSAQGAPQTPPWWRSGCGACGVLAIVTIMLNITSATHLLLQVLHNLIHVPRVCLGTHLHGAPGHLHGTLIRVLNFITVNAAPSAAAACAPGPHSLWRCPAAPARKCPSPFTPAAGPAAPSLTHHRPGSESARGQAALGSRATHGGGAQGEHGDKCERGKPVDVTSNCSLVPCLVDLAEPEATPPAPQALPRYIADVALNSLCRPGGCHSHGAYVI